MHQADDKQLHQALPNSSMPKWHGRTDGLTEDVSCVGDESLATYRAREIEIPTRQFRILVTGSRKWPSENIVWEAIAFALCENLPDGGAVTLVHGACPTGADHFAHTWFGLPLDGDFTAVEETHPADWDRCVPECRHPQAWRRGRRYCPAAGHRRNQEMVELGADLVLAFPLPGPRTRSRGTWDCVRRAKAAGIPVEVQALEFTPRLSFADGAVPDA